MAEFDERDAELSGLRARIKAMADEQQLEEAAVWTPELLSTKAPDAEGGVRTRRAAAAAAATATANAKNGTPTPTRLPPPRPLAHTRSHLSHPPLLPPPLPPDQTATGRCRR